MWEETLLTNILVLRKLLLATKISITDYIEKTQPLSDSTSSINEAVEDIAILV